jgi:hypothetical protein
MHMVLGRQQPALLSLDTSDLHCKIFDVSPPTRAVRTTALPSLPIRYFSPAEPMQRYSLGYRLWCSHIPILPDDVDVESCKPGPREVSHCTIVHM